MGSPLRFAGLGLMLTQPSFEICLGTDLAQCIAPAPLPAETARRIEDVIARFEPQPHSPLTQSDFRIEVTQALPLHSGLGAGTQLACAVAVGLELCARVPQAALSASSYDWQSLSELQPAISANWLVEHSGRGLRSAVGLHGFLHGGLVLDHGQSSQAGAECRTRDLATNCVAMSQQWRVVLVWPNHSERISGQRESEWIAKLSEQPNPARDKMFRLAEQIQAAAITHGDFENFVNLLDEYMAYAAQLFQRQQGGMYNGPEIAAAVRAAQDVGLRGVGQSSWGPTVFGFAINEHVAHDCSQRLAAAHPDWPVMVSSPAQHGARWRNC